MNYRPVLWVAAVLITLASAVFQRTTGPTYPARGHVTLGNEEIRMRLLRTHGGPGDMPVTVTVPDQSVQGEVAWRRFPTQDPWQQIPLARNGDRLEAALPHQPVAGKLEYQVHLRRGRDAVVFPPRPAITRYRNDVPLYVLLPHIAAMFFSMLFSTVAGLSALGRWVPQSHREARINGALLFVGGFLLGPLMQYIAFGAWWTGIPFGWDLTDNKTLFAAAAWAIALWRMRGGRAARTEIAAAALVTLVIFAIPHSVWGSEFKWDQFPAAGPR
jgi:hypothetical protein